MIGTYWNYFAIRSSLAVDTAITAPKITYEDICASGDGFGLATDTPFGIQLILLH